MECTVFNQASALREPLTLADLRGQVVLVHFWTFACSNCAATLPYVTAWYDTYHDQGFTVIGVHAPEFGFETSGGDGVEQQDEPEADPRGGDDPKRQPRRRPDPGK